MFKPLTLKFLMLMMAIYGLLLLPALGWPSYLDSSIGLLLLAPWLSIYVFHKIGVPGLLENNGLCGWGWCAPTMIGWLLTTILWLIVAWLFE